MSAEPRPDLVPVDLPTFARDDLPVSRGMWRYLATAYCQLAGVPVPSSQYEAAKLLVRLREELEQQAASTEAPPGGRGDGAW